MEESDIRVAELEDVIRLALCESMWSSQEGRGRLGRASDGLCLLPRSCRQLLCRVRSLSVSGKATLARCIGRRDEWVRVACGFGDGGKCGRARCVRHCVDPHDLVKDRRALTASVCRELIDCGMMAACPSEGDAENAEDRVATAASIARSSTLTNIHRRAWLVATNCHHRKGLATTADYVQAIAAYAGQRSLGGGAPPLWAPLRSALSTTSEGNDSDSAHDKSMPVLLRINSDVMLALRRARRLYVAVVDGGIRANGLGAPAVALYLPNEHHAPASARLWVHGRRINHSSYTPFASRRDFLCWEAAVELRAAQDSAIEKSEIAESLELWERRHRRRLQDEATSMKETLKTPVELEKERQAERGRAKVRAQNCRDSRELGPPADTDLLESLNRLFDYPDFFNTPFKPSPPESKRQKTSRNDYETDERDGDDDDDRRYDRDESFSARSASVGRVLAHRCNEKDSSRRCALWAVACLRKCMTWRHLSEGGRWSDLETDFPDNDDWEGPFSDLEFRMVLVEVAFRGISGKNAGSFEACARNKRDRWEVVDLLRFLALCCLGPASAEWRGRIRSRLSICLSGRKAPREGHHLKCPRARLDLVSLALGDRDVPADIRVEFEKTIVALYKKRNADGIDQTSFFAKRHATTATEMNNRTFPTDVVQGGNPLSRRVGEHSQIVSHVEDELTLGVSVEEYVLEHYALDGWYGIHCEGRPLRPLAILLLWDCLYADDDGIDGAFITPWQVWPRDLHAPRDVFRRRRTRHLDELLARVRHSDDLAALVENAYCAHSHEPALSDVPPLSFLQAVALGLGPESLAAFLNAFAGRFTTSGLPDLLMVRVTLSDGTHLDPKLFRAWIGHCHKAISDDDDDKIILPSSSSPPDADTDEHSRMLRHSLPLAKRSGVTFETRLVEVKSYNDSLWEGQIVWFVALLEAGIDARIATLPLTEAAAACLRKGKMASPHPQLGD